MYEFLSLCMLYMFILMRNCFNPCSQAGRAIRETNNNCKDKKSCIQRRDLNRASGPYAFTGIAESTEGHPVHPAAPGRISANWPAPLMDSFLQPLVVELPKAPWAVIVAAGSSFIGSHTALLLMSLPTSLTGRTWELRECLCPAGLINSFCVEMARHSSGSSLITVFQVSVLAILSLVYNRE